MRTLDNRNFCIPFCAIAHSAPRAKKFFESLRILRPLSDAFYAIAAHLTRDLFQAAINKRHR